MLFRLRLLTAHSPSYEGWLMKQGGLVPSWKRRLWRLDSWGLLSYFESAGKPPQGHINISDVTHIRYYVMAVVVANWRKSDCGAEL